MLKISSASFERTRVTVFYNLKTLIKLEAQISAAVLFEVQTKTFFPGYCLVKAAARATRR